MSYLRRYLDGEHEAVWRELGLLDVHALPLADAEAVAQATMERVAANVDTLIDRLAAHGYELGLYPDGERVPSIGRPRAKPDTAMAAAAQALEAQAGPLPIALRMFWKVVGEVSLVGRAPRRAIPAYSDPLWIYGPRAGLVDLADHLEDGAAGEFLCSLAPDVLHKDNVSGGAPYAVALPSAGLDAPLRDEWHDATFVAYLRVAILNWGGFPGLSDRNPHHAWRNGAEPAPWVAGLKGGLVRF